MRNKFIAIAILLIGVIAFESCQKDNLETNVIHNQIPDYDWGLGDSIPIVAPFYFKGKIDSQLYTLQDSIQGYANYVFDSALTLCPDDTSMAFYEQATGFYTLSGLNSLEIRFLVCADTSATGIDSTVLDSLLGGRGTFHYGSSDIFNPIDGVEVVWTDINGKVWKTITGSGADDNNSFFIQSVVENPAYGLGHFQITGTMSLTLYNDLDKITLESGEFIMQYGVY
jgi:hypothetical protein